MRGMNSEAEYLTSDLVQRSEKDFYEAHSWCLNPILKLSDLLRRLGEEIDHYDTWPFAWQRMESRINFYLFTSAILCTVDDYLFWRPWRSDTIPGRLRVLRSGSRLLLIAASFPHEVLSRRRFHKGREWKDTCEKQLEKACRLLIQEGEPTKAELSELREYLDRLRRLNLPIDLLNRRMNLVEGYRRQDLTHHDVVAMADKFIEHFPDRGASVLVVGPRTAGLYFAPIVKIHLEKMGFRQVSWSTVRPQKGLFPGERMELRRRLKPNPMAIIVDDYSNTGLTFRLSQEFLTSLGVPPKKITLLAPIHPRKRDVRLTDSTDTTVLKLEHKDLYKTQLLDPANAGEVLRQYMDPEGQSALEFEESLPLHDINLAFQDHYKESFQARLKRVYHVSFGPAGSSKLTRRIFAKSVGWGWLGYHAYLAADRLAGFVPGLIGLRNGILYTEWIEGRPMTPADLSAKNLERMGAYVAHRSSWLPTGEDPRFQRSEITSGWSRIISILGRPYIAHGVHIGFLKNDVLRENLRSSLCPHPSMVDGGMSPRKWITDGSELTKVDFEHHNFGEPEFDVVDPAYDLAVASFEFSLSSAEEQKVIEAYISESGDHGVRDRIFLFKLLYGNFVRSRTLEGINERIDRNAREELNRRYLSSWNSLTYNMNAYSGGFLRQNHEGKFTGRLFFLDLDDVFDTYAFGYPHTTPSALKAVLMLHAGGFKVIPNTGRSMEHVSNYCSTYGFPQGIAEYGSVFVDNKSKKEVGLVTAEGLKQLSACSSALASIGNIFTDPGYRYSVRAYRFSPRSTQPLALQEARDLLTQHGFQQLTFIPRPDATYFVEKGIDKGTALEFAADYLGYPRNETVAIGDSDVDIPMLAKAGHAFAPANCSADLREFAHSHKCQITKKDRQRGLLEVATRLVQPELALEADRQLSMWNAGTLRNLMLSLMKAAEASRLQRAMALLRRNKL